MPHTAIAADNPDCLPAAESARRAAALCSGSISVPEMRSSSEFSGDWKPEVSGDREQAPAPETQSPK